MTDVDDRLAAVENRLAAIERAVGLAGAPPASPAPSRIRFCMSSAATAAQRAFGLDRGMPFPLEDVAARCDPARRQTDLGPVVEVSIGRELADQQAGIVGLTSTAIMHSSSVRGRFERALRARPGLRCIARLVRALAMRAADA